MKDFFQRNSPIFVIGFFTLVVFLIIIIFAQFKKQISPELKPITDQQMSEIKRFETPQKEIASIEETDKNFPAIEIIYNDQGFEPKNSKVVQNQLIKFTNKSKNPIKILQITDTEIDYKDGIYVEVEKTVEIRLTTPKTWAYREEQSDYRGSIFVIKN